MNGVEYYGTRRGLLVPRVLTTRPFTRCQTPKILVHKVFIYFLLLLFFFFWLCGLQSHGDFFGPASDSVCA